jgi:hypothetical protein
MEVKPGVRRNNSVVRWLHIPDTEDMILKQQNVKPGVCCKIPIKPYQKSPKIY